MATACAAGSDPWVDPTFRWEGQSLIVEGHGQSEDELCGGTLEYMDEYVGVVAAKADASLAERPYFRWVSTDYWETYMSELCPGAGCFIVARNSAFGQFVPMEHELAHAAIGGRTTCPPLLTEGLAEYFNGSDGDRAVEGTIADTLAATEGGERVPGDRYGLAGHFVSFLVERHGLESILRACELTVRGSTIEQFSAGLEAATGENLDQLIEAYAEYPVCSRSRYRSRAYECERAADLTVGLDESRSTIFGFGCDDDTIGVRGEALRRFVAVEFVEPGTYEFSLAEGSGASLSDFELRVEECAPCSEDPRTFGLIVGQDNLPELLPAGKFMVEIRGPSVETVLELTVSSR